MMLALEAACQALECALDTEMAAAIHCLAPLLRDEKTTLIVLGAGDSLLGPVCAVATHVPRLVLYDVRYFQKTEWWSQETMPRLLSVENTLREHGCELVARREPKSLEALTKMVETGILLAEDSEGTACLRAVRCVEATGNPLVFSRPPRCVPNHALLRHAARNAIFAPCGNYQFSARQVRDSSHNRDECWEGHIRRALECCARDHLRVSLPVVWSAKDQLEFVRIKAHSASLEQQRWKDLLVASSADRYVAGGYADFHYVKSCPNQHEVCFELVNQSKPAEGALVGFISLSAEQFNGGDTWPFSLQEHPLDVCTITRLVVKEEWRGKGLATELLGAVCDIFHREVGLPVRITTRKAEVAEKVFGSSVLFAPENSPRRKRLALQIAQKPTLALVPYGDDDSYHTKIPTKVKTRGHNNSQCWTFWYVGSDVVRGEARFTFIGGPERFSRVPKDR